MFVDEFLQFFFVLRTHLVSMSLHDLTQNVGVRFDMRLVRFPTPWLKSCVFRARSNRLVYQNLVALSFPSGLIRHGQLFNRFLSSQIVEDC